MDGLTVDDSNCDGTDRPNSTEECNEVPCDGVEWIETEWSSCDDHCGSQMQTRKAVCSDQNGNVFPNEACDQSRIPETTRMCPDLPTCTSLWFTSEWSSCSAKCGTGLQTRHVFCGHLSDSGEIVPNVKADCQTDTGCATDIECSTDKPENVSVCTMPQCEGIWFTGPYERCTGIIFCLFQFVYSRSHIKQT